MRAAVAMSGGVDSSVTAALMLEQGYDVFGLTMDIGEFKSAETCSPAKNTPTPAKDAQQVCDTLGIQLHVVDFKEIFRKEVLDPFTAEYAHGRTPNPCVLCNRRIKFGHLFQKAQALGADILATGHYARIGFDETLGRFCLRRGVDRPKDQSYFLFGITKPAVANLRFPLGEMTKETVRELADRYGFHNASKRDSQDVCFIQDGSYADFIARTSQLRHVSHGEIIDLKGNVLGHHEGYFRHTIGQRRGLGVASTDRLYVVGLDATRNQVVLGPEAALYRSEMIVENLSFIDHQALANNLQVTCQIRSRHAGAQATLCSLDGESIKPGDPVSVTFEQPQSAITPGQAAVFYVDDEALGGGWIASTEFNMPSSAG